MKKITPLVLMIFMLSFLNVISQDITHSASLTIKDNHSISCNTGSITRENTYYRSFVLNDFSITSSYDITSVEFGIERIVGTPTGGYPVKVSIYTTDAAFPTGNLTLISEVTEMITDQNLTLYAATISASIPANSEFVVGINVPSDVASDGGNNAVTFDIGANDDGETDDSYLEADACSIMTPTSFTDQGRPDIHVVMNIVGNGATAGVGDLEVVNFSFYPNPVKETLFMNAQENITSVSVYNLLGQEIKKIEPSQLNATLDLTSLASGTYLVRAHVNDNVGSFKIIKD